MVTRTKTDKAGSVSVRKQGVLKLLFTNEGLVTPPTEIAILGDLDIGRSQSGPAQFSLQDDKLLSAKHAQVRVEGDAYLLLDRASKNGTFLNGTRLQPQRAHLLTEGDIIRAGGCLFIFRMESGSVEDADETCAPLHDRLLGYSTAICRLRAQLQRAAASREPVLLIGDSGTGKELSAQALHQLSKRTGPFLAVNATTINVPLAESTLFGNTGHAFTNAKAQPGYLRQASGGTLFLDEIGDIPMELQPKLLRVLEEGTVLPVGAVHPEKVDVRYIFATNRDLALCARTGSFRRDLYMRISTLEIRLPTLHERREDLLYLLFQFLGGQHKLSCHLCELLLLYPFPGNIRELGAFAKRLFVMDHRREHDVDDVLTLLPSELRQMLAGLHRTPIQPGRAAQTPVADQPEPSAAVIEEALRATDGRVNQAAARLQMPARTFRRWLDRLKIRHGDFRKRDGDV